MNEHFVRSFAGNSRRALELAREAANACTFGVGAVLVDPGGKVISENRNRVFETDRTPNTGAHAELLNIRKYFERRRAGEKLPSPGECVIISTLDPCIMCAAAAMRSGFRVISLALDQDAGINARGPGDFTTVPPAMRPTAERTFALAALTDRRPFFGFASGIPPVELPSAYADHALRSFVMGRNNIRSGHRSTDKAAEPAEPLSSQEIRQRVRSLLKEVDPDSLSVRADPASPGIELGRLLTTKADRAAQGGNSRNACALIDPHGNVLLSMGSGDAEVPLNTPLMRLTLAYESVRRRAGVQAAGWLPDLRRCTVVQLYGFDETPGSLMDIAIMRSPVVHIIPAASSEAVDAMLGNLPDFYRRAHHGAPRQVSDKSLTAFCLAHDRAKVQ